MSTVKNNFLFSIFTRFFLAISGFISTSLIVKSLSISDFGLWNYIFAFISIISIFALSGYGGVFNRFVAILLAKNEKNAIFPLVTYFLKYKLLMYVLLFPIFLFLKFNLKIKLICYLIFVLYDINLYLRASLFQSTLKYNLEFIGVIIGRLLWLIFIFILYEKNLINIKLLLYTFLLSEISSFIIFLFFTLKFYKINVNNKIFKHFTKKDFWNYYLYSYLSSLAYFVIDTSIDKLMLKYFFSSREVGIYSAAVIIPIYIVNFFPTNILTNILATKFIILNEKGSFNFRETIFHYMNIGFLLYLVSIILYFTFSDTLIRFIFGDKYLPFLFVFDTAFSLFCFKSFLYILAPFIQVKGLAKAYLLTYVSALLNVILNFLLIPKYNVLGAILATGFSVIIHILFLVIYLNYKGLKMKIDYINLVIFLLILTIYLFKNIDFNLKFIIITFLFLYLLLRSISSIRWFFKLILKI